MAEETGKKSILEILEKISFEVSLKKSLEEAFELLMPIIAEAFEAEAMSVWLIAEDKDHLQLAATYNLNQELRDFFKQEKNRPKAGEGVVGRAFGEKKVYVVNNILSRDDIPEEWRRLLKKNSAKLVTLIAHPIYIKGEQIAGVVNLYFKEEKSLSQDDASALRIVTNYLGSTI